MTLRCGTGNRRREHLLFRAKHCVLAGQSPHSTFSSPSKIWHSGSRPLITIHSSPSRTWRTRQSESFSLLFVNEYSRSAASEGSKGCFSRKEQRLSCSSVHIIAQAKFLAGFALSAQILRES